MAGALLLTRAALCPLAKFTAITNTVPSGGTFIPAKLLFRSSRRCRSVQKRVQWSTSGPAAGKLTGIQCAASTPDPGNEVGRTFSGMYGPWTLEESDKNEVYLYRGGIVTSALCFVVGAAAAFLPSESPLAPALDSALNPLYALGATSLGLSLVLVHMYVTPIKRTIQALWAFGVFGSLLLALNFAGPAGQSLPAYVVDHPAAVWAVGPLFAALTGLAFKEGLCYGKLEAFLMFLVIPATLLGHLGGMDRGIESGLLAVWTVLYAVFGVRKFSQPIKDDIGDKSIFIFNALPEERKQELLEKLGQQRDSL